MKEALDLFCCAGGFGKGLSDAGFLVTGVDIVIRPNYPFKFLRSDALEYLERITLSGEVERYTLISAGPPCQHNAALTVGTNQSQGWGNQHVDLLPPTRELLRKTEKPYVIEQPTGKAKMRKDLTLCGEMFGLGVLRHRHFELGMWQTQKVKHVPHRGKVRGWRHGEYFDGPYVAAYGAGGGKASIREMQEAMQINWTAEREELTEAIPPAYGKFIGERFLRSAR